MPKTTKSTSKGSKSQALTVKKASKQPLKKASTAKRKTVSKSKKTKSSKNAKINFSYLLKSFGIAFAALAVILGAQFINIDNAEQVAGSINTASEGRVYMVVPEEAKVGDTVRAEVWSNSSQPVNAVQADIVYSEGLEYIKVDDSDSAYDVSPPITNSNNMVKLPKGTMTPLINEQRIAVIEFKAVKAGQVQLGFNKSTKLITSKDNKNIAGVFTDYSLNITEE